MVLAAACFLAEFSQHRLLTRQAVTAVRPCGDERAAGAQALGEPVPQPLERLRPQWTARPVLGRAGHPHRTDRPSATVAFNACRSPDLAFMTDWTDTRRFLTPIWPTTASVGVLSGRCLGLWRQPTAACSSHCGRVTTAKKPSNAGSRRVSSRSGPVAYHRERRQVAGMRAPDRRAVGRADMLPVAGIARTAPSERDGISGRSPAAALW